MNKLEIQIIAKIAERADKLNLLHFDRMSLMMDLEHAHKQFNLRLNDLLNADEFNFTHDISGIQSNIDRETKEIHRFLPRFVFETGIIYPLHVLLKSKIIIDRVTGEEYKIESSMGRYRIRNTDDSKEESRYDWHGKSVEELMRGYAPINK